MFRITVVSLKLTRMIQKITYLTKDSSGLYLSGYSIIPKVYLYTPSGLIHHNNRVTVPLLSPSSGGGRSPHYKWGELFTIDY